MIWNDERLRTWAKEHVKPYDPACVNPASLDLRLGSYYRKPIVGGWGDIETIPIDGLVLEHDDFVLLSTLEYTKVPEDAVAFLMLKSSTGRKGLEHLHAGYGDPGFAGQWTLEIINHWPHAQRLVPGQRLVQIVLADAYPPAQSYQEVGHYQHQVGPTPQYQE